MLNVGDCIYLNPDSIKIKAKPVKPAKVIERPEVDSLKYEVNEEKIASFPEADYLSYPQLEKKIGQSGNFCWVWWIKSGSAQHWRCRNWLGGQTVQPGC